MSASHPSGLAAGDRVLFRSEVPAGASYAPLERVGTLIDDPRGQWVRVQYDDQVGPDSAMVDTLTRISPETAGAYTTFRDAEQRRRDNVRTAVDSVTESSSAAPGQVDELHRRLADLDRGTS